MNILKFLILILTIFLVSCSSNNNKESYIIQGPQEEVMKLIRNANQIFYADLNRICLQGEFDEVIDNSSKLKTDGTFKILIDYAYEKENKKHSKYFTTIAYHSTYFDVANQYYHDTNSYLIGPFIYQHNRSYYQKTIYEESKIVEIGTKDKLEFFKEFLMFIPFYLDSFHPSKVIFHIKNQSTYCCYLEKTYTIPLSLSSLVIYQNFEFQFSDTGFYQFIDYRKYYSDLSYPTYHLKMNVAYTDEEIVFPNDLDSYEMMW